MDFYWVPTSCSAVVSELLPVLTELGVLGKEEGKGSVALRMRKLEKLTVKDDELQKVFPGWQSSCPTEIHLLLPRWISEG